MKQISLGLNLWTKKTRKRDSSIRWRFGLNDPAMEGALHDVRLCREFAKLDGVLDRLPDESTILRFRHLLEKHNLAPICCESSTSCCSTRGYC